MLVQHRTRILSRNVKSQNLVYSCFGASKITATGFLFCFRLVLFPPYLCLFRLFVCAERAHGTQLAECKSGKLPVIFNEKITYSFCTYGRDEKRTCSVPDRGVLLQYLLSQCSCGVLVHLTSLVTNHTIPCVITFHYLCLSLGTKTVS